MHGNILNNDQILSLVKSRELKISPFVENRLRLVDYPLVPKVVFEKTGIVGEKPKLERRHVFDDESPYYDFLPHSYYIVEIEEHIVLPHGIVGYFTPASPSIELGFGITAGRIQPPFGEHGGKIQKIRFGVKNLTADNNRLHARLRLAHIHFVDLRSLRNLDYGISKQEKQQFEIRSQQRLTRAADDGVRSVVVAEDDDDD